MLCRSLSPPPFSFQHLEYQHKPINLYNKPSNLAIKAKIQIQDNIIVIMFYILLHIYIYIYIHTHYAH